MSLDLGAQSAAVTSIDDLGLGLRSRADGTKDPLALPRSDVIIWRCADGTRVAVRPSGTEPKVKIYLQVVLPVADHDDRAFETLRPQARHGLATGLTGPDDHDALQHPSGLTQGGCRAQTAR